VKGVLQTDHKRTSAKTSEATRLRLLETATREFGAHGYSAVSTRELAKAAKVNLSAIPYHFGGKEGLYQAVIEKIVTEAQNSYGSIAKKIQTQLEAPDLRLEEGERLIRKLIRHIASFLVGQGNDCHRATLIIRELMSPSAEFKQLYDGFMEQMHSLTSRLIAALIHEDPESEANILRTHALLGQIVFFSAGRHLIKTRTDGQNFTAKHLDAIVDTVTETFIATIHGMRASRGI